MADRERWNLRGRVHTCRLERTSYIFRRVGETCERQEHSSFGITEFREDGRIAKTEHSNPDGSTWTSLHEYDATGLPTTVRSIDKAGEHIRSHEYSQDGRLLRILVRSGDAEPRIVETYEYDAQGCRTKTFHPHLPPNTHMQFGVEGSDSAYSAPGTSAVQTVYNVRERPAVMVFLDASGHPVGRVELSYDANENLIEEVLILSAETLLAGMNDAQREAVRAAFGSIRRTHRYDEKGHRVETHSQLGPLSNDRRTMSYNEHGDRSSEINEHVLREHQMDDDGKLSPAKENVSRSESRIQYEYDPRGNWVTKKVASRSGADTDFVISSVERRFISWFE